MTHHDSATTRRTLTVPEAADVIGISVGRAWKLVWDGHLATVRVGTRRLVTLDAIDAFLASGGAP